MGSLSPVSSRAGLERSFWRGPNGLPAQRNRRRVDSLQHQTFVAPGIRGNDEGGADVGFGVVATNSTGVFFRPVFFSSLHQRGFVICFPSRVSPKLREQCSAWRFERRQAILFFVSDDFESGTGLAPCRSVRSGRLPRFHPVQVLRSNGTSHYGNRQNASRRARSAAQAAARERPAAVIRSIRRLAPDTGAKTAIMDPGLGARSE